MNSGRYQGSHRTVHIFCLIIRILTAMLTITVLVFAGVFTVPRLFGIEPFIVKSGSMEPTIHTGAVAFIDTKREEIERGDIIAFKISAATGDAATVTHRVAGATENGWITKGDANEDYDSQPVRADQLVGKYIFSIPKAGYYLDERLGETVVLLIVWVAASNLVSIVLSGLLDGKRSKSAGRYGKREGRYDMWYER